MDKALLKNLTMVYAEDEIMIREGLCQILRRKVGKVFEANNGYEAIELIKTEKPNFILTDIEMPQMDGIKLIQTIRNEYNGSLPIVVITGYHDEDHYTDLADGYVYKPTDLKELFSTIGDVAKRYHLIAE